MQPSYVYCKFCGYALPYVYIGWKKVELPTDDEGDFTEALHHARKFIRCPRCKNKGWIRKVYWKV